MTRTYFVSAILAIFLLPFLSGAAGSPSVSSVSPTTATTGRSTTFYINGSNFTSNSRVYYRATNGKSGYLRTTYISSSKLKVGPYIYGEGTYTFSVRTGAQTATKTVVAVVGAVTQANSIFSGAVSTYTTSPATTARTTNITTGTGDVATGSDTTVAVSTPVAIPGNCFGRNVSSGDWDDINYVTSEKREGYSNGYYGLRENLMHIVRFKTGPAMNTPGQNLTSLMKSRVVIDSGTTGIFVSPTPCDYTWAYNHHTVKMGSGYGDFDISIFTDVQAREQYRLFRLKYNCDATNGSRHYYCDIYDMYKDTGRMPYLLPNTYYYYHMINVDNPASRGIKTTEQLTNTKEECIMGQWPLCGYLILYTLIGNLQKTAPPPPPPDNSICTLPNGSTIPAGTSKLLWYDNRKASRHYDKPCSGSDLYCTHGALSGYSTVYGEVGGALYMTDTECIAAIH